MKREIKFRAWIPKENKMFYQNAQYLGSFLRRANMFQFGGSGHESYGCVELQQFTGLLDKNGMEIYEGDIIVCDAYPFNNGNYLARICWDKDSASFFGYIYLTEKGKKNCRGASEGNSVDAEYWWQFEVIGNIYENPNLLKEDK